MFDPPLVKGSFWRGLSKVLAREGLMERVCAELPSDLVERLHNPPLPSAWVPHGDMNPVFNALYRQGGEKLCGQVFRKAAEVEMIGLLQPLISGISRLFGASPRVLFHRQNDFYRASTQGLTGSYLEQSETSGELTLRFDGVSEVPLAVFYGIFATLEVAFDLAGVKGQIASVQYAPGKKNIAIAHASWSKV